MIASQIRTPPIKWSWDTLPFKGKVSAICRTKAEAAELVKWFGAGPEFCPFKPVLLCIPGGWGQVTGLGIATVAEIQDEAVARWELQEAKLLKIGTTFDFDEARERAGLMRRELVDARVREAMRDRVAAHRANPITDPSRQMNWPNPTGKQVFLVDGTKEANGS